jgi:hypothetical protein
VWPGWLACQADLPERHTHGVVSGTLHASDVIGPTPQNISVGNLASVERAIRNGAAYVNLHTTNFPGGEIRGQIGRGDGD